MAVLSLGELSAGKLVETPGSQTFAHKVFEQMHYGVTSELAALCLVLLAVVAAGGAVVAWFSEHLLNASGSVAKRQFHRHAGLGAVRHRFGEFHVINARLEVRESHRRSGPDRFHELRFHPPFAGFVGGDRNFHQFIRLVMLGSTTDAEEAVLRQVVTEHPLRAVKADVHFLAERRHAAETVDRPRAVFQDGQHLHAIRRADRSADAAFGIDARWDEGMDLGEDANRRRHPAQQGLVEDAEGQHVEAGQGRVLPPGKRRRRVGQGVGQGRHVDFPQSPR